MKGKIKFIIPAIIVVAVIIIFATHAEAFESFVNALTGASPAFIIIAIIVLCGRYFMYAWAFKAGFQAVGADIKMPKMIEIVMSITFINDTAPTAGMAGSIYLASWATKKGASTGGAISLVFLDKITFFGSFALIQTVGMIILAINNQLSNLLIIGSCVIYALALVFIIALYLSYRHPWTLEKILLFFVGIRNAVWRLFKSKVSEEWASSTARSCQKAAQTIASNPHKVARMFARMFALFLCEAASITFVCISFGFFNVAGIIAAYVAGFIMSMIVVQTVGIIEAVLVLMLTAFGADFGTATAISLVYRGLLFWAPFAIGALCIHRTSKDFIDNKDAQDKSTNDQVLE